MVMLKRSMGAVLALLIATPAFAATCSDADLARAVDQSGASLRDFSLKAQPPLRERMRRFAELAKISTEEPEDAALNAIKDPTLDDLDGKSAALLLKVDGLGRGSEPPIDCSKIDAIKSATDELLSVMKAKSDYMQARLDAKIAELDPSKPQAPSGPGGTSPKPPDANVATVPSPKPIDPNPTDRPVTKQTDKATAIVAPRPKPAATPRDRATEWSSKTEANDAYRPPQQGAKQGAEERLPPVAIETSPPATAVDDGYSVDEIREATRGFFGTVSTSLASVIEHAFKTSGRPTAYVLGSEGGGAFLAGLRFGKGTLYMRNQSGTRPVYWHGPSVGTDFGASGSRTMFLIYSLREPDALYRSFTGVDGSAYFVGGVGVTLLKGGEVVMAPIRSGIGFRVGASLGYVRFTDRPTWNPF